MHTLCTQGAYAEWRKSAVSRAWASTGTEAGQLVQSGPQSKKPAELLGYRLICYADIVSSSNRGQFRVSRRDCDAEGADHGLRRARRTGCH